MLLRKQLLFDLTNFRLNKSKYIFFCVEIAYFMAICMYPVISMDWAIVWIQVIQLVASITFLLSINTVFDGKGCEYTIEKLIYFPIRKSTILFSKGILIVGLALVQSFIAYLGTSIGRLFTRGESVTMLPIYGFAFIASILSFSVMFGIRKLKATIIILAFEIPMYIVLLRDLTCSEIDWINIAILIGIFMINIIVNGISFIKVRS